MKIIGNIIWLILVGLETALGFLFLGALWCITIIGIPFGKQCFKLARLMLWPFGTRVVIHPEKHIIANIIWIIFGGFTLGLSYLFVTVFLCITIIGIPFAKQCFKFGILAMLPFGAEIN